MPLTLGTPNYSNEEAALVLFFYDDSTNDRVKTFISNLNKKEVSIIDVVKDLFDD